jgi:hypothetical protein
MQPITLVFEDDLHKAVLQRVLNVDDSRTHWVPKYGKSEIDKRDSAYVQAALHQTVVILRDLDKDAVCAPEFLALRNIPCDQAGLFYRLAVRTVESWVMADKEGFKAYFQCKSGLIDQSNLDGLDRPKDFALEQIFKGSMPASKKKGIVSFKSGAYRQQYDYNPQMTRFVQTSWSPDRAVENSDSFRRFLDAMQCIR